LTTDDLDRYASPEQATGEIITELLNLEGENAPGASHLKAALRFHTDFT